MEYKNFEDSVCLRLDPGDEILESVIEVAKAEKIALAEISGIGATDDFTVGVFNMETNKYDEHSFSGNHEITNLCGTLTQMDGLPYQHLHITCANSQGQCVGGHLLKAKISLTAEIVINKINGQINRKHNADIGINQ